MQSRYEFGLFTTEKKHNNPQVNSLPPNLVDHYVPNDKPIEFVHTFNLAMEAAGILRDSEVYIETLARMDYEKESESSVERNSFLGLGYDAICTTGLASCHALVAFGYDERGTQILCLSHSFVSPAIAKEKIELLMKESGVTRDKINFILVGGTDDSWEEDIDEFVKDEPSVFCIAKNKSELNPDNEDDVLSETCTVYCKKNLIIVQQYELGTADQLKCHYSIKINDNYLSIEQFNIHNQRLAEPIHHSFQSISSYQCKS